MKKNIKVCLIFFTIILVILIINFSIILNKTGIIKKEKQIQKEMSSSNKETELNTQLTDANKSATEYANYVQTCKTQLASALTNEGVETSENDTFEKMISNIGDIFTQRTKLDESVAATADNISEGKQAWVNGELVTGNGNTLDNMDSIESPLFFGCLYTGKPAERCAVGLGTPILNENYFSLSNGLFTAKKDFKCILFMTFRAYYSSGITFNIYHNSKVIKTYNVTGYGNDNEAVFSDPSKYGFIKLDLKTNDTIELYASKADGHSPGAWITLLEV